MFRKALVSLGLMKPTRTLRDQPILSVFIARQHGLNITTQVIGGYAGEFATIEDAEEHMRWLTDRIIECTEGGHSLVWVSTCTLEIENTRILSSDVLKSSTIRMSVSVRKVEV